MYKGIEIIAEVKTQSPFGFVSNKSWDELFELADSFGDMISIHTDKRWGGSYDLLKKARTLTKKPILAKGIHGNDEEIQRALDAGADWVLVVGRIPQTQKEVCLIEPYTLDELAQIDKNQRVVWNARDLKTGERKVDTFAEARIRFDGWLCQASHIKNIDDVHSDAHAVLVGEHLVEFTESIDDRVDT